MIRKMYYCNLFASKKYYFYLFLTLLTSFKSFEDLRTIDNYFYLIFYVTYIALSLLKNDRK